MGFGKAGDQPARADEEEDLAVRSGQAARRQGRGGGRAARGELLAVDEAERLAGRGAEQDVDRVERRAVARRVAREHGDELHAEHVALDPGRHDEQRRLRRGRHLDAVPDTGRRRVRGGERRPQRFDEGWPVERRGDRGGGDVRRRFPINRGHDRRG
jgi:hypothetical protein